jgi:hypothetical protein
MDMEAILRKLPKYARSIPLEYLIQIPLCKRCKCARWARLNSPCLGKSDLRSAQIRKYKATCLVCGNENISNDSWSRFW